jgi:hypothetical protein
MWIYSGLRQQLWKGVLGVTGHNFYSKARIVYFFAVSSVPQLLT